MKKTIIVSAVIIIMLLLYYFLSPKCDKFETTIEKLDILPLDDRQVERIGKNLEYDEIKLDKDIVRRISKNPCNFKQIIVSHSFLNKSSSVDMVDIRVNYRFDKFLKERVVAYNSGHLIVNIILNSGESFKFNQAILVDFTNTSEKEILSELYQTEYDITYFTGPFCYTDGKEYKGIGKHLIRYKIEDVVVR